MKVTFLESTSPPPATSPPAPPAGVEMAHEPQVDLDRYKALFRRIGDPWSWFARRRLDDRELRALFEDPDYELHIVRRFGQDAGFVEIDFRVAGEAEIAYFGLVPEAIGGGLGRWLFEVAARRAWSRGIRRLWLHTCERDHPSALGFYRSAGLEPYDEGWDEPVPPADTLLW